MIYIVIVSAIRTEEGEEIMHTFPFEHSFSSEAQAEQRGKEVGRIRFPPQEEGGEWSKLRVVVFENGDLITNGKVVKKGLLSAKDLYVPQTATQNPLAIMARTAHPREQPAPPTLEEQVAATKARLDENSPLPPGTKPEQIAALVWMWWDLIKDNVAERVTGWNKANLIAFRPTLLLEEFMRDGSIQKQCQRVYPREHDIRHYATKPIAECCKQASQTAQA